MDEGMSDGVLDDFVFGGVNFSCLIKVFYWYIGISGLVGERFFYLNFLEFCYFLNKLYICYEEVCNIVCVYEYC